VSETEQEARRTCIACRAQDERADLLRLVLDPEGEVAVDLRAKLPGRGAWVHARAECLGAVEKDPRMLGRALRADARADDLVGTVRSLLRATLLDGLSLAAAGGALIGGADLLEAALREGRIRELLVATDAADRTVRNLKEAAPDVPVTLLDLSRDALGARVGRAPLAAVGVADAPAAVHLLRTLRRVRSAG
jgi:predicted RNA-binding protein YlxR (DUF448 family)